MPDPRDLPAGPPAAELRGEVESVVFHNEETGYAVIRLKPAGKDTDPVTVIGNLPAITPGERVEASGQWIDDRNYGKQFRAANLRTETPVTLGGIERFLGSGLIDGIGKEYARRIVEKFGTDVFDVIDQSSQRLEEIDGIGPKRRRKIRESWKKQQAVRQIMIFLHSQGIGAARAQRIYKTYGAEAIDTIRANPYRLASDIPGIGFKTADTIATRLGQPADSPARLNAGIEHALTTAATSGGHCALPLAELIRQSAELLGADEDRVAPAVARLVAEDRLVEARLSEERLVYLPELAEAEKSVAQRARQFVSQPPSYPEIDAGRAIEWFEGESSFRLGDQQRQAVIEALNRRFLIITGGPGVGKTTILRAVLRILGRKLIKPVLCAPTGRAAKRLSESTGLEAGTIHRLLEFQPDGRFMRGRNRPLEGDLFVIDEASMIDIVLMRRLLEAIPDTGHVLLVGDVDQLPSVGPGRVLADLIDCGIVPVARLDQIFRQAAASRIVTAAHAVNRGEMPAIHAADRDSDFFFIERADSAALLDTLIQVVSRRLPARYDLDTVRDIQVLTPMNRNTLGARNLNAVLQNALNPPAEWKFEIERFGVKYRAGDKVIQTRNDYEKEVFNGDIGIVTEIATDPARVLVGYESNREVEYLPGELDELQLAYAITIHRSQGSEFPVVVMPVATQHFVMLQRNLIYTGITRGKKLVVLIGDPKALAMAVGNRDSQRRWSGLKDRISDQTG